MKSRRMRVGVAGWLLAVLGVVAGCGDPLPQVQGDLAFVGVDVLPMTEPGVPRVIENRTVVVTDRRIASMHPADEVEVADGTEVVEAEGMYLMPGLAEMHGHLPGPRTVQSDARNLLFLYIANGVTTVRGMQGERSQLGLRARIARGQSLGPRLFVGSPSMTGGRVATPAQGAQLVREYNEAGYDLVKMHEGLSPDVFDAVAATAREAGLPFGGHVPDAVGLRHALGSGQVSIDHLDNYVEALVPAEDPPAAADGLFGVGALLDQVDMALLPELVDATRAAGASVVPTMVLWETVFFGDRSAAELRAARPEVRYMPPETVEQWERVVDERAAAGDPETNRRVAALRRRILQALHEGGVPVLLGTDSPQIIQRARVLGAPRDGVVGRGRHDPLRGAGSRDPARRRVLRRGRRLRDDRDRPARRSAAADRQPRRRRRQRRPARGGHGERQLVVRGADSGPAGGHRPVLRELTVGGGDPRRPACAESADVRFG